MAKIRITITSEDLLTTNGVVNAVRRTLKGNEVLVPGTAAQVGNVKYVVKEGAATPLRQSQAHIREWGAKNGFTVGARGRFSKDLLAAYEAANAS